MTLPPKSLARSERVQTMGKRSRRRDKRMRSTKQQNGSAPARASSELQRAGTCPDRQLKRIFAETMVKGIDTNATAATGYSKMFGEMDLRECLHALRKQA